MKPTRLVSLVVCTFALGLMPALATGSQRIPIHLPAAVTNSPPLGQLPASTNLDLAIGLPLRNQAALTNLLREIYDPASPNYRHYLTPERFTDRFGPTRKDYQTVIAFARANGLQVTATYPNRMLLDVRGSVATIEKVLHVTMRVYQHPAEARTFYAPDKQPTLDLTVPILGISGLEDYSLPRPRLIPKPLVKGQNSVQNTGSGLSGTYLGKDFRAAYVPDTTMTGSGQIVGLLQFDGYYSNDIAYYESQAGLPGVTLTNVLLDGFNGVPTGSGGDVEVSLDIEMAISMAPGLSKVMVYEAGPAGNWHDILNRMATDDLAKQLSCSWYIYHGAPDPVADQIWQEMAAQGQSFFNASGDDDAYTGPIAFPGDSPYITQVGGTTLTTSGPGGSWVSEKVWNAGGGFGSGGGISTSYPIPDWQTNINMTACQGSTTMRNTPDVALTADNVYVRADHSDYMAGGTSCAAPLWAGLTALINEMALQNGEPPVGFVNPAVYALGESGSYNSCFHDITTGNNESPSSPTKFVAVSGYDLCTGWGTPAGNNLLYALGVPEPLRIAPATSGIFTGPVGGPFSPLTQTYSLTNKGSATLNWNLACTSAWLNLSPTSGTLAPGGAPVTVTASLTAAATNLPAGSYTAMISVTDLDDQFVQNRQLTLAVVTPPLITTQPVNQVVFEGATAEFTVGTASNALLFYRWQVDNGSYLTNLADSGNISGSTSSTLVVSNVSAVNEGAYSVVISNAAGVVTSAEAFLSIIPWRPIITQQPVSQTVLPGAPVTFNVVAVGTHPFTYQWRRNGVNLTDGDNISGATTASLTINNTTRANAGIYSVVVSNALGSATSTGAVLSLIPVAAPGIALDTLSSFSGGNGINPYSPLVQGANGNFYGTTLEGGTVGDGTIFQVTTNGVITTLISFNYNNGAILFGGLDLGSDGNFYGMAALGGASGDGTIFRMGLAPRGPSLTTLVSFNGIDGYFPVAGLLQGKDGNFYGATQAGGPSGYGNLFRMSPNGALTNLFSFNYNNGAYPSSVLVQGKDGNLYGTTEAGGADGEGTVFKITPWGQLATVVSFNGFNGAIPIAGLVQDVDGNFYGTTYYGGTNDAGTVFKLTPDGKLTTLYSFSGGADGSKPFAGLTLGSDGNFYGTTESGGTFDEGTIFRISADGSFASLASFDGYQGVNPEAAPTQGADGNFYGTTEKGGTNDVGAVYRFSIDSPLQITRQPADQMAYVGSTATFSVATYGSLPVSYQWMQYGTNLVNGGNISGANARVLTLTNLTLANIGVYSVIASNVYGSVTSAPAVLQLAMAPPFITTQPTNQTVLAGETAAFSVTAEGDMPLFYQWQKNGTNLTDGGNISGSTTSTLVVYGATTADEGAYSVVVSDDLYWTASADAVLTVVPVVQPGFTLSTLRSFTGRADGGNLNGLAEGTNGYLYGTTRNGGYYGYGTVFRIATNGTLVALAPFNQVNGATPYAGLTLGSDGNFYGTTCYGGSDGYGNVFKMSPRGTLANLYNFTGGLEGYYPTAPLIQAADGNFYGATSYGGSYDFGTVFRIGANGRLTNIYSFRGGTNGMYPRAVLVQGSDGNFYGTTEEGGANGFGTVFMLTPGGTLTTLVQFNWSNGAYPVAGLVQGPDGCLYGTAQRGGWYGDGTVFRVSTNGVFTNLFQFNGDDGANPAAGLVQGADGSFYGTTYDGGLGTCGTAFKITTNGALTTLVWFNGSNGADPQAPLIQAQDGNFYGTTFYGGRNGYGTVFCLALPMPPRITVQPTNQTVFAGSDATFKVVALGTSPLSFHWQKDGTNLTDGANITGSTTDTLLISSAALADSGTYSVVVSNVYGSVTSTGAVLNVTLAAPVITVQPTNQTVLPGGTATFTAAAVGSLPMFYQWQENGTPLADGGQISGSATTTLTISNVSAANAGVYSVIVNNSVHSTTSTGAVLNVVSLTAPGVTLEKLSSLAGVGVQGANPNGLVLGADGKLYGTTQTGGTNSVGTVFALTADGARTDLYSFTGGSDGANPYAALIQGADGNLYGTALTGGDYSQGTVFSVSTNGTLTPLHSFTGGDGADSYAALLQAADGNLYGTTRLGGAHGNGTVFKITTNGALATLYSFTGGSDGGYPDAALVQGADGNFYGTTSGGGVYHDGTVFKTTTNGVTTTLYSFTGGNDGAEPDGGVVWGPDDNLYGTTSAGGTNGYGTVYEITTNGALSTLYLFTNASDGAVPYGGLLCGPDGNLYGTTYAGGAYNDGTVFRITTNGTLTTLATFDGYNGANPEAPLVLGLDDSLYGTTVLGGANNNGTVFRISILGLAPPPVFQTITLAGSALTLTWRVVDGQEYQLQYNSRLGSRNWTNLGNALTATGSTLSASDIVGSDPQRFYRLMLLHSNPGH